MSEKDTRETLSKLLKKLSGIRNNAIMSTSGGELMRDLVEVVAEIDTRLRKLEQG
jgi:hypothetical protein